MRVSSPAPALMASLLIPVLIVSAKPLPVTFWVPPPPLMVMLVKLTPEFVVKPDRLTTSVPPVVSKVLITRSVSVNGGDPPGEMVNPDPVTL